MTARGRPSPRLLRLIRGPAARRILVSGAAILALQAGCRGPCVDLDAVPLELDAAPEPRAWREAVRGVLTDFSTWTDGETCLAAVEAGLPRSLDRQDLHVGGAYDRWERRLYIGADEPVAAIYGVALHELCHAWDAQRGWPSADQPDRFAPERLPAAYAGADGYPTARSQMAEVFALACDAGPVDDHTLDLLAAGGCDAGLGSAGAWVQAEVYRQIAPTAPVLTELAALQLEARPVDVVEAHRAYDAVFAGGALWVVTLEHAPATFELTRVPLDGGPVRRFRPLPPTDPLPQVDLVGGPEEGLFVARFASGDLAWALADAPEPLGVPGLSDVTWPEAALLVEGALVALSGGSLVWTDLATGEVEGAALPPGLPHLSAASLTWRADGLGWSGLAEGRPVQGAWSASDGMSWGAAPTHRPLASLPDGRLVGAGNTGTLDLPGHGLRGWRRPDQEMLVVVEPDLASETWSLGGCGRAGLESRGAGDRAAHAWAGAGWLLGEDEDGFVVLRIVAASGEG